MNFHDAMDITGNTVAGFLSAICIFPMFYIAFKWRIFANAGYSQWVALVPIYNLYLIHKVAKIRISTMLFFAFTFPLFTHVIYNGIREGKRPTAIMFLAIWSGAYVLLSWREWRAAPPSKGSSRWMALALVVASLGLAWWHYMGISPAIQPVK